MLSSLRGPLGPRLRAALIPLVAVLLTTVVGAAPAGATTSTHAPRTWNVMVGQESNDGAVQGMAYGPGEIWINVGDTVHWVANSAEIHTVSFYNDATPIAPFAPDIAYMVAPTPEKTISTPGQFRNSGLMSTDQEAVDQGAVRSYDLTFKGPGTYQYVCYVHGQMMMGTVQVRPEGTRYPYSQQQYNAQAHRAAARVLADGNRMWAKARATSDPHHVWMGAADETALIMRFVRPTVRIRTGETVTFDMGRNAGIPVPHTVTFGTEPTDFAPHGDPTKYSGGDLSSGVLLPPGFGGPSTYEVTFTKPGTYHYICMFHDSMGMVGDVVVQ